MQTMIAMQNGEVLRFDQGELIDLYENLSPRLFRYAYRMLGSTDTAEECVAEVFSKFLQAIKDGSGPHSSVQAYLYRMVHNWVVDYYRSKKRSEEDLMQSNLLDTQDGPAGMVADSLERERVREALLTLTQEQQQVIHLRFFEEWSHEDIAALTGKTAEAIRALQYRALVALKRMLIEQEE
jgi:RNA polymerase sigma-70 factor, ECF subfamily